MTRGRKLRSRPDRRAADDRRRLTAHQRGYTRRWAHARRAYLMDPAHVLCAHCLALGDLTPATEVDHIQPHRGDRRLFWDRANWQPLCKSCHSLKTARDDGGFGNRRKDFT